MPVPPVVRPATRDELPAVGDVLAKAFVDDPVFRWLSKDSPTWHRRASTWFATEARCQFDGDGEVWVDDDVRGAAIWATPGHWRSGFRDLLHMAVPSARLLGLGLGRGLRTITTMERHHPSSPPHWYLSVLGADPAFQGHGIGGALIRAVTDRLDEEGVPAYLESSKPANVPYYQRFGFADSDPLPLTACPPLIPMWREPKVPT